MNHKPYKSKGEGRRSRRTPFLRWCLLPLVMAGGWAGCKQPASIAADPSPVGTYALVSVDGNRVPCTVRHGDQTLTVQSGSFIINPDGTCTSRVAFAAPSHGETTREVQATYTRQGARLTMKWQQAGITTGTLAGDTFTMNNEGMIFAYRK